MKNTIALGFPAVTKPACRYILFKDFHLVEGLNSLGDNDILDEYNMLTPIMRADPFSRVCLFAFL